MNGALKHIFGEKYYMNIANVDKGVIRTFIY